LPHAYIDLGPLVAAGGMHSTARDLMAFASAAAGLSRTALGPDFESSMAVHLKDSKGKGLALCWQVDESSGFRYHLGQAHAFVGADRKTRSAVVIILTAGLDRLEPLGLAALSGLAGRKAEFPKPRTVADLGGKLARYAGRYRLEVKEKHDWVEFVPEGKALRVKFANGGKAVVWPEDERVFYCREWDCTFTFDLGPDGSPRGAEGAMYGFRGKYLREPAGGAKKPAK
jgi:hypothetical protein